MKHEYLIDGYNLMHQIPDLKKRMDDDLESARDGLIIRLSGFLQRENVNMTVVFDGQERHCSVRLKIKVVYSKSSEEADHVIKRMIEKKKSPSKLTVVSSDNEIQRYAKLYNVVCLSSLRFLQNMTQSSFCPVQKKYEYTMTEVEAEAWLRIFQEGKDGQISQ